MSEADYRIDPRPSITQLAKLDAMPPLHARQAWSEPPTKQMRLGTAVHCAILTPDEFDRRYVRGIDVDRRTKDGKARWEAFLAEAEGREVLDPDDHDAVMQMRESVSRCDAAGYLRLMDSVEVPRFATIAGVECKGRPDAFATRGPAAGALIEIKTTSGMATPAEFERSIASFAYGFQAAGYSMLLERNDLAVRYPIFVVVESKPPHGCAVFLLRDEVIAWYRPRVEAAARLYAECRESGSWPGHPTTVQEIGLPRWHEAMRQLG
ncbi:MAG: PD-(D/E)XK nuclease-like domain-containing protein [Phycisphaerales bacterium]